MALASPYTSAGSPFSQMRKLTLGRARALLKVAWQGSCRPGLVPNSCPLTRLCHCLFGYLVPGFPTSHFYHTVRNRSFVNGHRRPRA